MLGCESVLAFQCTTQSISCAMHCEGLVDMVVEEKDGSKKVYENVDGQKFSPRADDNF